MLEIKGVTVTYSRVSFLSGGKEDNGRVKLPSFIFFPSFCTIYGEFIGIFVLFFFKLHIGNLLMFFPPMFFWLAEQLRTNISLYHPCARVTHKSIEKGSDFFFLRFFCVFAFASRGLSFPRG